MKNKFMNVKKNKIKLKIQRRSISEANSKTENNNKKNETKQGNFLYHNNKSVIFFTSKL